MSIGTPDHERYRKYLLNKQKQEDYRILELKEKCQELVDLVFQIGLTISSKHYNMHQLSIEERAAWIADQLNKCGFETTPCGACWGLLKNV